VPWVGRWTAILSLEALVLYEKISDLGLYGLDQQRAPALPQDFGELVVKQAEGWCNWSSPIWMSNRRKCSCRDVDRLRSICRDNNFVSVLHQLSKRVFFKRPISPSRLIIGKASHIEIFQEHAGKSSWDVIPHDA
jgi:hypothetical protein